MTQPSNQNNKPPRRKRKATTADYVEIHTLVNEIIPYLGDLEVALEDTQGIFIAQSEGGGKFAWGDAKQFELAITAHQLRVIQTIRSFLDSAALRRIMDEGVAWDRGEAIAQELHLAMVDGGYCTHFQLVGELKALLQKLKNTKWYA